MIFCKLITVPITHPKAPNKNIKKFFIPFQLNRPRSCQFEAVSMIAGAIKLNVDIFTDPSKETNKSSHGTVAANKTAIRFLKAFQSESSMFNSI